MALVIYFRREELPEKSFFDCERYKSTVTVESCAGMWRQANHLSSERLYKCKACPVGAIHAGETAANLSPVRGTLTCARCQTGATRLIHHHLCVSCYNRQREWVLQCNSKGKPPIRSAVLERRTLWYMVGHEPKTMDIEYSANILELMWAALRDSRNTVKFGFHGGFKGPITQLRLF